ncbi:hypothetical protein PYR74_10030 [Acinetobacter bereziniae]|uniref:hypothetical protein n=1 Tax=Acinetobacter bereziniae TaxID=106648 RepID=UPI0015810DD2|nr:hypothetical protein [Acinetobacter bereziniae]NUF61571.1 hypothetical protein [Acinetobacter bereziniae]NUG08904.1 hypothetical protein [Acinetobacter bereziniae]NUG62332.1 hypothetical protein [Acinetobacter bereziniae]NUG70592.1 hypothetical protein [Acinetobacter bereziniae]NUG80808.1 hypothetical protein [Acinetobacter bereziniae]
MELQVLEQNAIVQAFNQENGTKSLFEKIANEARSVIFDMSVKKERDALKSFAYNLARTKTTVDSYGKDMVSGIKAKAAVIDADRKFWRDNMDLLQEEIRKPLTDFENAEKDRVAKHEGVIAEIKNYALIPNEATSNDIKEVISIVENAIVDSSFEEYEEQAKLAKFETLEKLRNALVAREKYEAEQAELERLRQAEIARQQEEHDEKIAREAAEKARIEAEEKALADRKRAEQEKIKAEQREAQLKAEKEAALLREQQLKQQAIEREKQAEIDRQKAVEAERLRIEQEAKAKSDAELKEQQAREANKAHKKKICNEALQGLMNLGVSKELGKQILQAIHKGEVPHVSIKF